jgi:hypothetical protein
MFIDYGLNILKRPTLPYIAFANLRTNYLDSNFIVSLDGNVDRDIRNSWVVDVFKLSSTDWFYYDVNSLYSP